MRRIAAVGLGVFATGLFAAGANDVSAQSLTFGAAGETGGDEIHLVSSELGLVVPGLGIKPFAMLGAYMVFAGGDNSWGVTPAAGLRYVTDGGSIEGSVGWVFVDDPAAQYFRGDENGFLTSLRTEFLGDVYSAEGIAAFNWGAKYLWSRGRLGRVMGTIGTGGTWGLGGELVYQAETEDPLPSVEGFRSTQIGPVLMLTPQAGGPSFAVSGGWKKNEFSLTEESTWYVRGEIFLR